MSHLLPHGSADPWVPFMAAALDEARAAQSQGEVPVGAVVVRDGTILGRAGNRTIALADPTAHAEILALRQAAAALGNHRLTGCVLVVTLEPCLMCVGALLHARVAGVVFAARDPKAGCLVSRLHFGELAWSNHRFWVREGVLAEPCSAVLTAFFESRRSSRRGSEARS